MDQYVVVGRIVKAVGLKGDLLVRVYSQIESITDAAAFFLRSGPETFRKVKLISCRPRGDREAIIRIEGISDRASAEAVLRHEVYQHISMLPRKDADEYYQFELKGLMVVDRQGRNLGTVHSILETRAGDILVVRNACREILVPMLEDVIEEIDIERRRCVVSLPPGLEEATSTKIHIRKKETG